MKCSRCGRENLSGSKYCLNCGAELPTADEGGKAKPVEEKRAAQAENVAKAVAIEEEKKEEGLAAGVTESMPAAEPEETGKKGAEAADRKEGESAGTKSGGNGGKGGKKAPEGFKRGTGWKVAVVVLCIAVIALGASTAYFSYKYRSEQSEVEEITEDYEELETRSNALPYVLEGFEAVSRQTVNVINKYFPGNKNKTGEWQDYVTDSLTTIEQLSEIYRKYLQGGELENASFLETVEKIVNEFLESDEDLEKTK